jgi:hypothetical protein
MIYLRTIVIYGLCVIQEILDKVKVNVRDCRKAREKSAVLMDKIRKTEDDFNHVSHRLDIAGISLGS